ncbi:MAG: cupin domain-containing protein [Methylocella sp.]
MKRSVTLFTTVAFFALAAPLLVSPANAEDAIIVTDKDIQFAMVDPKDPMAGEIAVLAGDPSKPGLFAVRIRLKAGSVEKTHSHSAAEYATVLSGKARMSFGNTPDETKAVTLTGGSFLYVPAGQTHTMWVDEDIVGDVFSTGPFDEKYVEN